MVIRLSSMGDVLLTTPALRCLKAANPGCEIHFLTKKTYAPLIENNPNVDRVIFFEGSLGQTIDLLRQQHYTGIVDLHGSLRSLIIKLALWKVPCATIDKRNLDKWLLVRLKWARQPIKHIVTRYIDVAARFGAVDDGLGMDLHLTENDKVTLPHPCDGPFLALVIGAQHRTKKLPIEKLAEIVRHSPLPVAIIGGPEDAPVGQKLAADLSPKVWDTCGKLSLRQSAFVIGRAKYVVAHDTGMMHVAAALQKQIWSVWGSTVPAFGMEPYGAARSEIVEVNGLPCRPCSKLGHPACPKGHFACMKQIHLGFVEQLH